MTPAWCATLGLQHVPFSKELDDAALWLPPSTAAVVDELLDALDARASVLLTGEPGVGKTCVLRALRQRLPAAGFRLTSCHNATLGRRDFSRQLCLALGLTPSATAAAVFWAVTTHVQELGRERTHPVFLLDEAHLLHQDTLDHLPLLLNSEWDRRALLSLVLVGLPELRDRLAMRRHRSLSSRLHRRLHIDPLVPDDTAVYVRTRLAQAGGEREVFPADALAMLHEATGGALREIDRLATAALRATARTTRKLVERDTLARVLDADAGEPT